jgi:hypothetical protein
LDGVLTTLEFGAGVEYSVSSRRADAVRSLVGSFPSPFTIAAGGFSRYVVSAIMRPRTVLSSSRADGATVPAKVATNSSQLRSDHHRS